MTYAPINKAVPLAGLLDPGDDGKLAFQGTAWTHLTTYLKLVGALPPAPPEVSARIAEEEGPLRSSAEGFGSPRRLRALLAEDPAALASKDPPGGGYAGLVWLAQRLHTDAQRLASEIASLVSPLSPDLAQERVALLHDISARAALAMHLSGPLRPELADFKARILKANQTLAAAVTTEAHTLQELQVEVGRLEERVRSLERTIGSLSILTGKKKKQDLQDQLHAAQASLQETSTRAARLRALMASVEPVLDHGRWLEPALDGVLDFLESHRKAWMSLSTGLTEIAARASSEQLLDARWMQSALGAAEAQQKWAAIGKAAKDFTVQALVDG